MLQPDLPEAAAEPGHAARRLTGSMVDLDALAVRGLALAELELTVEAIGRRQVRAVGCNHVTTAEITRRPPSSG